MWNSDKKRPQGTNLWGLFDLEVACFFEGKELIVSYDDMVQHLDAQNFTGLVQAFGKVNVVFAGRGVSAGVAVGQDYAGGSHEDCGFEALSRVNN